MTPADWHRIGLTRQRRPRFSSHEAAGQSVNHFHVHLIPRYKDNDRVTIEFHEIEKPDFEELMNKLK